MSLALPKGMSVKLPHREPDMVSKRGVPYWFAPEWSRNLNGTVGRIVPLKKNGSVQLHLLSKEGNASFIQGSIQDEFLRWHEDQQIDCILLGIDEDDIIATNWEYV